MEKDLFKRKLKDFIERNGIKTASSFNETTNNVMVVTAVEDFDPNSNDMWDIEDNKSYPRELHCYECQRQVVVSGGMYKMYEEATVKPLVGCSKCVLKKIQ